MTDPTLVAHLVSLYQTAEQTRSYRGETVEDVLDRRWPDDPDMRRRYRMEVIDRIRARRRKNDFKCRFCGDDFPSYRARVSHEVNAHPKERAASIDRAGVLADYDAGDPLESIAGTHGLSKGTVSDIVRAAGRTGRRAKRRTA